MRKLIMFSVFLFFLYIIACKARSYPPEIPQLKPFASAPEVTEKAWIHVDSMTMLKDNLWILWTQTRGHIRRENAGHIQRSRGLTKFNCANSNCFLINVFPLQDVPLGKWSKWSLMSDKSEGVDSLTLVQATLEKAISSSQQKIRLVAYSISENGSRINMENVFSNEIEIGSEKLVFKVVYDGSNNFFLLTQDDLLEVRPGGNLTTLLHKSNLIDKKCKLADFIVNPSKVVYYISDTCTRVSAISRSTKLWHTDLNWNKKFNTFWGVHFPHLALSPDGKQLLVWSSYVFAILDSHSGRLLHMGWLAPYAQLIGQMAFRQDGKMIYTPPDMLSLSVWEISDLRLERTWLPLLENFFSVTEDKG